MWHPMAVNPQTWINNGYFKTKGWVCVNIALKRITITVFPSKTFAYSKCKRLNEGLDNSLFEKESES